MIEESPILNKKGKFMKREGDPCPCNEGTLVKKFRKRDAHPFLACDRFPDCTYCTDFMDREEMPSSERSSAVASGAAVPGSPDQRRASTRAPGSPLPQHGPETPIEPEARTGMGDEEETPCVVLGK